MPGDLIQGGPFQQDLSDLYSLSLSESEVDFTIHLLYLVQIGALDQELPSVTAQEVRDYLAWMELLEKKGHLEAYNYWLMQDAAPLEFGNYLEEEGKVFEAFESWFYKHSFLGFARNPIVRPQARIQFDQ